MTRTLIKKELRQHWAWFLLLAAIYFALLFLQIAAMAQASDASSVFDPFGRFGVGVGMVIAAAMICSRLVAAEYRSSTQLFLEALPLSRLRFVLVKYLFGLGVLAIFLTVGFALACLFGLRHEILTPKFAGIMLARAGAYTLFWFGYFFATSMLGRYRWPIWVLSLIFLMFSDTNMGWDVGDYPPFSMLGARFASERDALPLPDLWLTLGIGAGLGLFGISLALVREGGVAEMVGQKMGHREKVFIAGLLVAITSISQMIDGKPDPEPFELVGSLERAHKLARVQIDPHSLAGGEAQAGELAAFYADEIGAMAEFLRFARPVRVFLQPRGDLDADKYERAILIGGDGVVARVNFDAEDFDRRRFLEWLAGEVIDDYSRGRARRERVRIIRDGFGAFWSNRASWAQRVAEAEAARPFALRAAYGFGQLRDADRDELPEWEELPDRWLKVRELFGEGVAEGVAWSLLQTMAATQGADKTRDFLAAALGRDYPEDARAAWIDFWDPLDDLLEDHAGIEQGDLAAAWRAAVGEAEAKWQGELAAIPNPVLRYWLEPTGDQTCAVRFSVLCDPPPDPGFYRLRYVEISPLNAEFHPLDVKDDRREWAAGENSGRLHEEFALGLAAGPLAAEVKSPALGCAVSSGWRRFTIDLSETP